MCFLAHKSNHRYFHSKLCIRFHCIPPRWSRNKRVHLQNSHYEEIELSKKKNPWAKEQQRLLVQEWKGLRMLQLKKNASCFSWRLEEEERNWKRKWGISHLLLWFVFYINFIGFFCCKDFLPHVEVKKIANLVRVCIISWCLHILFYFNLFQFRSWIQSSCGISNWCLGNFETRKGIILRDGISSCFSFHGYRHKSWRT